MLEPSRQVTGGSAYQSHRVSSTNHEERRPARKVEIVMTVGVSDKPFGMDDIDDGEFAQYWGSISCK